MDPRALTLRRITHRVLDSCRERQILAPALAFPPTRRALNALYETVGRRTKFGDAFWRAVDEASVRTSFGWRTNIHGRTLRMPIDSADARGTWHAALNWSWSGHRHMRRFYEHVLKTTPPGVFFDIGANCGTHSLPLALHGWHCAAFEPQLICLRALARAAALNGLSAQVSIERVLVSDTDDEMLDFFLSETTWTSSVNAKHVDRFEPGRSHTRVLLPTITIDTFCARTKLVPTVIKVDVEGWEMHVLRGAEQTIRTHRPIVVVEVAGTATHRPELFDFFRQMRYGAIALMTNSFQAVPFAGNFVAHESENFAFVPPHQLTSAGVRDCS